MELSAIIESQISADRRRGFRTEFESETERLAQLEKDLIGLVGEVGEFANLLKKVRLAVTHTDYGGPSFRDAAPNLREELVDMFIYLLRLSAILGGDFENDLIEKMRVNSVRYSRLEKP
jgi:NTP pyrophosphatase (non-canonical NTP hydrolase)